MKKATVAAKGTELVYYQNFYESLRFNGLDICNGLGEFSDNSIQAHAKTIKIWTEKEKVKVSGRKPKSQISRVVIADDGIGMDQDTLAQCLTLGASPRPDGYNGANLSRFGMGMPQAAISLARRIDVYTRPNTTDAQHHNLWMHVYIDMDEIAAGEMQSVPPVNVEPLPDELKDYTCTSYGTLVVLSKCEPSLNDASLSKYLGRTYRKFILEKGIRFFHDGKPVLALDPLFLTKEGIMGRGGADDDGEVATLSETKGYEFAVPGKPGKKATVMVTVSLLPEPWYVEDSSGASVFAKNTRIIENEGYSVLREGREVFYGSTQFKKLIGSKPREADRWWGLEISFPAELDSYFDVKFVKSGITPGEQICDALLPDLRATISSYRHIYRANRRKYEAELKTEEGKYAAAEEAMASAKTRAHNERTPSKPTDEILDSIIDQRVIEKPKTEKARKELKESLLTKPYSIEVCSTAPSILFETEYLLRSIILKLNCSHPFFEELNIASEPGGGSDDGSTDDDTDYDSLSVMLLAAYAKAEVLIRDAYRQTYGEDDLNNLFLDLRSQWSTLLNAYVNKFNGGSHV